MEVPNVKRKDYQLIGMDDDFLSLMDDSGDTRDDLKCPSEDDGVGKEVRDAIDNETDILVCSFREYCSYEKSRSTLYLIIYIYLSSFFLNSFNNSVNIKLHRL